MKSVSIIGARPQFIKYAPLSTELRQIYADVLVHTGQHYDYNMSKVFFDELNIPQPDYNLEVGSGTHAYQTGEMLKGIESILLKEKPDIVVIYGDTNSTLAAALSASKLHIKLAHIEAGLRNFDKSIPEEINRVVADYCSDYLFCPTQTAIDNLKKEGLTKGVFLTGDVMVDALNNNKKIAECSGILDDLGLDSKHYILIEMHRAGNTDNPQNLGNIVNALTTLSEMGESLVFPVHPRTEKLLKSYGLLDDLKSKVKIIEPQGYFEFLKLLIHAKKIITDSGGIQKEAYILKVPCITLMDNTPWIETLKDGWNVTVGTDKERIVKSILDLPYPDCYSDVFGQGACRNIVKLLS
jgi:UDP-N-acetylglucosamine 2-epimerase